MTRKIASIKEILNVSPIPNADSIELATIDGWQSVIKKGQFKPGDQVIFCEPDALLPDKPEFEFMRPKKFRIKTCRLRGALSQGICFPMDLLPPSSYDLGEDVSEILGITKYEPPIPMQLRGRVRCATNRLAVPKTDEIRVQNIPGVLSRHANKVFNITEKLDGCVHEDTLISLPCGNMLIKDLYNIKYRGKILSYDITRSSLEWDDVVNISKTSSSKLWMIVTLDNGMQLKVTSDHLIYLLDENIYKRADELLVNDHVGVIDS